MTRRLGVYPGSFNPPTIGHLAIAEAARDQRGLDRVDFTVSRVALGKEAVERPSFDDRIAVLETSVADIEGLAVVVTDHQLLVDIAQGYDAVVMGADKWAQVLDPAFYGDSVEDPRPGGEHTARTGPGHRSPATIPGAGRRGAGHRY